ncbi:MAG: hypothetical protein J6C46_12195 [Clostridia bacterium]|nr:hypothetical protein [Clostridia bacterium]
MFLKSRKSKDAFRVRRQFSEITNAAITNKLQAEKKRLETLKQKAFEKECLIWLIQSFQKNFDTTEHERFFTVATENCVKRWHENQNFSGALVQLEQVAQSFPESFDVFCHWAQRQHFKYEYAVGRAKKNNFDQEGLA